MYLWKRDNPTVIIWSEMWPPWFPLLREGEKLWGDGIPFNRRSTGDMYYKILLQHDWVNGVAASPSIAFKRCLA